MDTFTATVDPNQPQSLDPIKKPSSHFRILFLILLIAVLASAGATTYILTSKANTPPQTIVETVEPNPFDTQLSENPLDENASETASAEGMFSEETGDNFFDQFESEATPSDTYENPF